MVARAFQTGVFLALVVCAAPVLGGEPLTSVYVLPSKSDIRIGEPLIVRLEDGIATGAAPIEFDPDSYDHFFVRQAGAQENLQPDQLRKALRPDGHLGLAVERAGVALVGFDARPVVQRASGRELKRFFTDRAALRADDPTLRTITAGRAYRVRHCASGKTLVRVGDNEGRSPSDVAQSKTGQAAEIRPLADPTALLVGSDLPVRAYVQGSKRSGATVIARHVESGAVQRVVTDPVGAAHFRITAPGAWRVEFHQARRLTDDAEADWELHTATLSFDVAAREEGR